MLQNLSYRLHCCGDLDIYAHNLRMATSIYRIDIYLHRYMMRGFRFHCSYIQRTSHVRTYSPPKIQYTFKLYIYNCKTRLSNDKQGFSNAQPITNIINNNQ